ncbi:hypothetical protein CJF31_00000741 [Rutstroemia sp. NJR-2017a BVV2]|nr:hypothetical protein CJF31_00000741 [Rutstroemia sp. NJR-2017a BVV2]
MMYGSHDKCSLEIAAVALHVAVLCMNHSNHNHEFTPTSGPLNASSSAGRRSSGQDAEDNKDVLIQRLNDLLAKLSHDDVEDSAITELHRKTDEMETLLKVEQASSSPSLSDVDEKSQSPLRRDSEDLFWARPLTPTSSFLRWPRTPLHRPHSRPRRSRMTVSRAADIAESVDELNSRLVKVITDLQVTRAESNRIHALRDDQLRAKTHENASLQARVAKLEKDLSSCQSLVNYRRVEKKATAAKYTKFLADETLNDELDEGIVNWRRDWERLNRDKDMGSEGHTKVPLLESPGLSEKMRLSIE